MDGTERLAGGNRVADFFVNDNPDGRIDGVFFLLAAASENYAGGANLLALNGGDKSGSGTANLDSVLCGREPRRIVDGSRDLLPVAPPSCGIF